VEDVFRFVGRDAIVFHGTADPWADTGVIRENCKKAGLPLYETEGANHSLETGKVDQDIKEMRKVMKIVREYAQSDQITK
jgi:hypothetical protein